MKIETPSGRTLLLIAAFAVSAFAGVWLGAVAAHTAGAAVSGTTRLPGGQVVAGFPAAIAATAVYAVVRRTETRITAIQLPFVAACGALNIIFSLYFFAQQEVLCLMPPSGTWEVIPECRTSASLSLTPGIAASMLPTVLVVTLLCLAEVRRSTLLRYAGSITWSYFALVGFLLSLARMFV